MALLHLFLILPQLLLHAPDGRIHGPHQVRRLVVRHKVVLVLGCNFDINLGIRLVRQINHYVDRRQSVKNSRQLLGLGRNLLLRRFTQLTMPGGYLNLHNLSPLPRLSRKRYSHGARPVATNRSF